jgi:hypothetical protein
MSSADESLNKAEDLLALADLAREVEAELQRAKRAAETEAAAPPNPDAPAS